MSFIDLDKLEERELLPGFRVRMVHTDNMTLAYWTIKPGSILPNHSHSQEQVTNLLAGELELTIEGVTRKLKPGFAAVIPPNVEHAGKAITECKVLDIFHPVRADYKEK